MVANIVRSLDGKNFETEVFFASSGSHVNNLESRGVKTRVFSGRWPIIWRLSRFLYNLPLAIIARRYDVIHIHSIKNAIAVIFAKAFGKNVVFHIHELAKRKGIILKYAMKSADCVIYCGNYCEIHYTECEVRRKLVLPNTIIIKDYVEREPNFSQKNVLMLSFYGFAKGQDLALKAFSKLINTDVHFHFYGSTGLSNRLFYRRLRDFAEHEGIADRVFFHDSTDDPQSALATATLLVLPSRSEAFGLVLLEAMASGIPVVAHDAFGMKEVVIDQKTGFLVPLENVDVLAECIDALLSNPDLALAMGKAGRQHVCENYDMNRRIRELEDLYRELAERSPSQ